MTLAWHIFLTLPAQRKRRVVVMGGGGEPEAGSRLLQRPTEPERGNPPPASPSTPSPRQGAPKKQPITLDGPWGTPLCASLFYTVFALTLLYASGLNYLLLNLLTQMGVRPSQALLAVFLPFNTLLGEDPASLLQVRQNGYLDTDGIRGLVFSGALPFFVLAIGVEIAGAVLVFGRRLHRVNDSINSLSMGLGDQLCGAVIGSMLVGPYAAIHSKCALLHVDWTHNAAAWWGGFLAVDLAYYWFHRCSHEVSFLWASHAVHHGSEEYNLTTALRQSFWGSAGFVFYLPLAFLFPLELALAHKVINLLFQFWIHTRTVGRLGPLEWVLNTPSAHRVHHGRNPWCIDKNFAGTLIIWDRLFCTYQAEEEVDEEIVYGVVPPLATWQPVWGQTHHYVEMAHNIYRTPGCCNKLQLLVRPPGWQWDGRKNRCRHFAVPRIGHKVNPLAPYDPPLHPLLTTYAAVQFGTMLLGYFVLVTSVPESGSDSVSRGAAVAVYAAATAIFAQGLVSIAAVLDSKPSAMLQEAVRLPLALAGLVALLAWQAVAVRGDASPAATVAGSPALWIVAAETLASACFLLWWWWRGGLAPPTGHYAKLGMETSSSSPAVEQELAVKQGPDQQTGGDE